MSTDVERRTHLHMSDNSPNADSSPWENKNLPMEDRFVLASRALERSEYNIKRLRRRAIESELKIAELESKIKKAHMVVSEAGVVIFFDKEMINAHVAALTDITSPDKNAYTLAAVDVIVCATKPS